MTEPAPASQPQTVTEDRADGGAGMERDRRRSAARALVGRFFEAVNAQDREALMGLVSEEIVLDCHPQHREWGREALDAVLSKCQGAFREHVFDIEIMTNLDGSRAAAEYTVLGVPITAASTEPEQTPQSYRFNGGLFFEIRNARIERLSPLRNAPRISPSLL